LKPVERNWRNQRDTIPWFCPTYHKLDHFRPNFPLYSEKQKPEYNLKPFPVLRLLKELRPLA
jgi:hypothetical protein